MSRGPLFLLLAGLLVPHAAAGVSIGQWVVGFHESHITSCSVRIQAHFESHAQPGQPAALFVITPFPVWNSYRLFEGRDFLIENMTPGGIASFDLDGQESASPDCDGIAYVAASNGQLVSNVTIADQSGRPLPPTFSSSGTGTVYAHASGASSSVGRVTLRQDVSAGWTHMSINTDWQPLDCNAGGARIESLHFPADTNPIGTGGGLNPTFFSAAGSVTPFGPGCIGAETTDYTYSRGVESDTQGTVIASIAYAETSRRVSISLMQMPISTHDVPPGFHLDQYIDT